MLVPVILGGGAGTRLWPLSRRRFPKQFAVLGDSRSMLRATADRLAALAGSEPPMVVVGRDHAAATIAELADRALGSVILEPVGRNTAPAAAVAAIAARSGGGDPVLLVLPSDHLIADEPAFAAAVARAEQLAAAGELVTFGIVPDRPETGYGYIQPGDEIGAGPGRRVTRFVEKPDEEAARHYLGSGGYLWNSGMFAFRASRYLDELERYAPEIVAAAHDSVAAADRDGVMLELDEEAFAACPANSIDYAVMEHTEAAVVVPLDAGWSDVGSWHRAWEVGDRNADGNVIVGDVVAVDTHGSYVRAEGRLVVTIGLDDVVVVETPDAVLVCRRDQAEDVKRAVDRLVADQRPEADGHPA